MSNVLMILALIAYYTAFAIECTETRHTRNKTSEMLTLSSLLLALPFLYSLTKEMFESVWTNGDLAAMSVVLAFPFMLILAHAMAYRSLHGRDKRAEKKT